MGCISSSPQTPTDTDSTEPKGLVRKMTITVSTTAATDDINISKIGIYYVIQGTKAVMDIHNCHVIGYLDDNNIFHQDESDYVTSICKKFDIQFVPVPTTSI